MTRRGADWPVRGYVMAGLSALALGIGGFLVWAVATEIDGAVVAPGRVEAEARRQSVQHPDGGVVAAIEVHEGDRAPAGDALLRLDGTELEARQLMLQSELHEALARMDRLRAEAEGAAQVTYRPELLAAAGAEADLARLLRAESALFDTRSETLAQQRAQLAERMAQAAAEIDGHGRQLEARRRQLALIARELADQQALYAKGLTQYARVSALQREAAELEGEAGRLEAAIAQARSARAGFGIEALRLEAARREQAQDQLRSLQPRETELRETLRIVQTRLGRLVLRAPMAGRVLDLRAHTLGGVIAPGADVASIVPDDVPLVFAVRIDPRQIDRVRAGQPAELRFPNFDSRSTPVLMGRVRTVSADTITDPGLGVSYYTAELVPGTQSQAVLAGAPLQPGMPLEAFIQTGARSPASFLIKPVADYFSYAMRED